VLYSALTTLIAFGVLVTIPIPVVTQFAATVLFGLVYGFLGARGSPAGHGEAPPVISFFTKYF